MSTLTVEIFFVGVTRMIPGNYENSILKPRFFGSGFKEFAQGDVGVSDGVLHSTGITRQFPLIRLGDGVGVVL